jgi:predicted component of type VI protein secretion system
MASYQLVMRTGPTPGKSFPLDVPELTIGRDLANKIVINDPEISRRHCRLFLQGTSYLIEDLGSTNGTSVNGQRIMGAYPLRPGELVTFGEHINLLYEMTESEMDSTVASVGGSPATVQAPFSAAAQGYPSPVAPSSTGEFAGHVPASPDWGTPSAPVKKKFPVALVVILALVLLCICVCVIGAVVIDTQNQWCPLFGTVFNVVSPGLCP